MDKLRQYELIVTMLKDFDLRTGNQGAENVIHDPRAWTGNAARFMPLYGAAAEILLSIQEETAKATTPAQTFTALKRIISDTEKNNPRLAGVYSYGNHFPIVHGNYLIILNKDIPELMHNKDNYLSNDTLKSICEQVLAVEACGDPFPVPSVQQLKQFLKAEKARGHKPPRPVCLDGFYFCNAQFLINIMQALPGAVAIRPASDRAPMYFIADTGRAMLLPVHASESIKSSAAELAA